MRVFDIHSAAGALVGFEISNMLVSRWRACRIARAIPGARVVRWPRRWAWSDDEFCEFEVDGIRFTIEEPFGDNSRYLIAAGAAASTEIVERVRAAFAAAGPWDWYLGASG